MRNIEVAVSRFLKHVVAGQEHPGPPRLERDEFNRIKGIPDPPYDTFICQSDAYSIIHLFLHDYDDDKILSFCGGIALLRYVMTEQDVWNANKRAIAQLCSWQQRSEADLGKRSKDRKDNQNVPIAPRSRNRGLAFVFLWRKTKDALYAEHP